MKIFARDHHCRQPRAVLLLMVAVVLSAGPLIACPEETVDYGTLYVKGFKGRILPIDGEELLPGELDFTVMSSDSADPYIRRVSVQPNGEFMLPLGPGSYRFKIKAEGFLFTLVGTVVVGDAKETKDVLTIRPPWC